MADQPRRERVVVRRTGAQVDDGGALEHQVVPGEGAAQPLRARVQRARRAAHAGVELDDGRMRPLRRGERGVGIGQQRTRGAVEAVREAGDAGRGGDAGDGRDDRDEVGGELARVGHARLGEQDRELAAGDARHEVGRPQPLEQRARHRAAAGIVRPAALEHDHRARAVVAARQRGLPVERDRERPCGGQTCELVGSGRHPQPTRRGPRPSVEHASAAAGSGPFSACGRTIRRAVAGGDPHPALRSRNVNEHSLALAREWKRLGRAATFVALLTSPIVYVLFVVAFEWRWYWSLLAAFTLVVVFRGAVDVLAHKLIPAPTIYGAESELAKDDVISRRRLWYWRKKFRRTTFWGLLLLIVLSIIALATGDSLGGAFSTLIETIPVILGLIGPYALILPMLFLVNFLILFGPMVVLGAQQMKGYEPGDADWGVKLADIRGQVEAKEEITRVVSLWQSGEEFEKAGGKRERGVLFLGPPGTGKTMLSKGIATSFNCPFVTMPGSGFAQMFIGLDAVIVRMLARKAKKLAAKWGGQCIVFIDEIDAVGMRRRALGTGFQPYESLSVNEHLFYGPDGALTPDGDLVIESRAWRDRLFALRAEPSGPLYPAIVGRLKGALDQFVMPGGMGGGSMALNQLLVVMDGIDDPPLTKRVFTNRVNTFLDALYIVPQRVGPVRLRKKPAEAAQGGDLLHRRLQRAARDARPRAHAPGPDGPPHPLPHAHVGGPARHLRPLHREGRPRPGPRHAEEARRARAHHLRLLPGHDRPGLLDGADLRARRRPAGVRVGGHRRGDDDRRVGRGDRPGVPAARGARRPRSTRPATRSARTSTTRT